MWDLLLQSHALLCASIFSLVLDADFSFFSLFFFYRRLSVREVHRSGSSLHPFLSEAHRNCCIRGQICGGSEAGSVGFLGCGRCTLIALFGEGVCAQLQLDIPLT